MLFPKRPKFYFMKKIALLIIACVFTTITIAQTWNLELKKLDGVSGDLALFADENGYMYYDAFNFIKVDEYRTLTRTFDTNLLNTFHSPTKIEKVNQDYFISTTPGRMYRMDNQGNIIWQVDGSVNLSSPQIVNQRLSSFVIQGNDLYFSAKGVISAIDLSNGTVNNIYPINSNYLTVAMQTDGSKVVLLVKDNSNSQYDILVFENGTITATYNTGFTAQDFMVSDDGYVIAGTQNGDATIKVMDKNNGTQLWSQNYGTGIFYSIVEDGNEYVACGGTNETLTNQQLYNGILTKVDENGTAIWSKTFDDIIKNRSRTRIVKSNENNGYVFGTTTHLIKTDLNGNTSQQSEIFYPDGAAVLDGNNIQTLVTTNGSLFFDGLDGMFQLSGDSANTIFHNGLWMGGLDAGGNLKMAVGTSGSNDSDYNSGFIGTPSESMQKVWKVTQKQINELRRDFDNNGVIDQSVPFDILTYPGRGNPNYVSLDGNTLTLFSGAPFWDRNNDGIYNIYDGDFPTIRGDMQLLWIMNDSGIHYNSLSLPLEFNIIGRLYAYECNGDGLVDNTVFLNYIINNQSNGSLDSLHIGMWTDFDLGCYLDDYVGSIPSLNSYFAYNGDAVDGQTGCTTPDFGTDIPIQSITYLNRPLDYFTYYSNGLGGSVNIQATADYYDLLSGSWTDGTPMTYGGTGYNSSTTPVNHVFSGNPSDSSEWSMASENLTPADYRTIGSTNFGTILPGEWFIFETAFITHENIPHPNPDITPVEQRITRLQNHYDNRDLDWNLYLGADPELTIGQNLTIIAGIEDENLNANYTYLWSNGATTQSITAIAPITYSVTVTNTATGCSKTDKVQVSFPTSTAELVTEMDKIAIFPNPAHDVVTIDITALDNENLTVQLIDITGRTIKSIQNQNSDFIRFDVSNVAQGVYFVTFLNDNFEKIGTKKVVILD